MTFIVCFTNDNTVILCKPTRRCMSRNGRCLLFKIPSTFEHWYCWISTVPVDILGVLKSLFGIGTPGEFAIIRFFAPRGCFTF